MFPGEEQVGSVKACDATSAVTAPVDGDLCFVLLEVQNL